MKTSKKLGLAALTALGISLVAVPVIAHQSQFQQMGAQGGGMGMIGQNDQGGMGMMGQGGGMGMMGQGGGMGMMGQGGGMGMMGQGGGMGMMDQGGGMGMMGSMMGVGMTSAMAAHDADGDGILSDEERAAGVAAEIARYDANADGTLSLDEFATMHAAHTRPMTVRIFQMHDADGDAQVTNAEMTALADMMQGHGQGAVGRHGHGQGTQDDLPRSRHGQMDDN